MKIRILRVLEYEYENVQAMINDMSYWTSQHNNGHMRMRSAIFAPSDVGAIVPEHNETESDFNK